MQILLGLGNPGPDYAGHRHNMGFRCVDHLTRRLGMKLRRSGDVWAAVGQFVGVPVVVAKPRTFMNRSGRAARDLLDLHADGIEDLLVIHDDVELELGTLRIKRGGGHGGHNGLRSIIQVTGSHDFIRIRLGVGRPGDMNEDLADWVLSDFAEEECSVAVELAEYGADAVEAVLTDGVAAAMNLHNVPRARGERGTTDECV
ncbi:MAG: aminoacyl-tRNA hydrolase [Acidobacteria bacterium]|nr:aminoacyl-tRNA hydrolase [Acidobacteriota bacterium]